MRYRLYRIHTANDSVGMLLEYSNHDFKLVWSTRDPLRTYRSNVMRSVMHADPRATIIDTDMEGRKNMVNLAEMKVCEMSAEAVIVISNKPIDEVVNEMSKLNILSYGLIFDS